MILIFRKPKKCFHYWFILIFKLLALLNYELDFHIECLIREHPSFLRIIDEKNLDFALTLTFLKIQMFQKKIELSIILDFHSHDSPKLQSRFLPTSCQPKTLNLWQTPIWQICLFCHLTRNLEGTKILRNFDSSQKLILILSKTTVMISSIKVPNDNFPFEAKNLIWKQLLWSLHQILIVGNFQSVLLKLIYFNDQNQLCPYLDSRFSQPKLLGKASNFWQSSLLKHCQTWISNQDPGGTNIQKVFLTTINLCHKTHICPKLPSWSVPSKFRLTAFTVLMKTSRGHHLIWYVHQKVHAPNFQNAPISSISFDTQSVPST